MSCSETGTFIVAGRCCLAGDASGRREESMTEEPSVRALIAGFVRVASTLAGIALLGIAFDLILGVQLPRDWGWRLLGSLPLALGLALEARATQAFWVHGRGTPSPETHPQHLVTEGPYSWSRHPLYLARHLILLGVALLLASPTLLVLTVLLFVLVQGVLIPREEARLAGRFDGLYEDYRKRVAMWITLGPRRR
jgi:protein-S-isoprenylcysteine O-methyltransferase Ste14